MKKSREDVVIPTRSKTLLDELVKKTFGRRFESLVSYYVRKASGRAVQSGDPRASPAWRPMMSLEDDK